MEKIFGRRTLAESKHFKIEGVDIDFGNGKQAMFEMVKFNVENGQPIGGVIICGYDKMTKEVVMIEQFQVIFEGRMLLLPRGGLKEGYTTLETAKEEFLEETGYEAKTWIELPMIFSSPGFLLQQTTIFLALDISLAENKMEGDEVEDTIAHRVLMDDAVDMIMKGEIIDARTISAIMMVREYINKNLL